MGRGCTMDEWIHFEKLVEDGRVPNSSYWYVHCRHCVRGYEQNQLFNAPAKLTGRRSAMRAHLKVCPMYAAQYKMEQHALATSTQIHRVSDEHETATGEGAVVIASTNSDTTIKRKRRGDEVEVSGPRGGRGKHCLMEEWDHFTRLQDEGYIGKSNFFYAICRHCQLAYETAPQEKKPLLVPERMVGRREKMRKHLSLCPHFIGELPSMERRMAGRSTGGGGPMAFLPMPTPEGIKMVPASALVNGGTTALDMMGSTSGEGAKNENGSGGMDVTPSSRLALDEWQAFTRLHRKKDSAYYFARCNFCQQAYENAPEALKPSMSPTIVMGRKSNMQTHLAKCPYVPKQAHTFLHRLVSTETFKRLKTSNSDVSTAADLTTFYTAILEFTIQHGLSFTWVESSSALKLLQTVENHGNTSPLLPTAKELRGPILDDVYDAVLTMELEKLKQTLSLSTGTTEGEVMATPLITTDVPWPVALEVSVQCPSSQEEATLNCWVTAPHASVPISLIVEQSKPEELSVVQPLTITHVHGLEIARLMDTQLRQVHTMNEELAIRLVRVPTSPVFTRAIGILRSRWPCMVFVYDSDPLIKFCLRKALQLTRVQAMVAATAQLWANDPIVRAYVQTKGGHSESWSPLVDWRSIASFTRTVLDMPAAIQALVEKYMVLTELNEVSALLTAFTTAIATDNERNKRIGLAETMMNFLALYEAAQGFDDVQRALEVAWAKCEQPLYLLALALHPQWRHKALTMAQHNVKLAQLSVLSDYSVLYFTQCLSRKPTTLRGDVTSFLHLSKSTFSDAFINEFPVMDDYFRYLSDNYGELAAMMRVLESFSSSRQVTQGIHVQRNRFTVEEYSKMEFLAQRLSLVPHSFVKKGRNEAEEVVTTSVNVVTEWLAAINESLTKEMVDFSELDDAYQVLCNTAQPFTDEDQQEFGSEVDLTLEVTAPLLPLPTQASDDTTAYPSSVLKGIRGRKVQLAQLVQSQVIDV